MPAAVPARKSSVGSSLVVESGETESDIRPLELLFPPSVNVPRGISRLSSLPPRPLPFLPQYVDHLVRVDRDDWDCRLQF
jgi:hypothetical protein